MEFQKLESMFSDKEDFSLMISLPPQLPLIEDFRIELLCDGSYQSKTIKSGEYTYNSWYDQSWDITNWNSKIDSGKKISLVRFNADVDGSIWKQRWARVHIDYIRIQYYLLEDC